MSQESRGEVEGRVDRSHQTVDNMPADHCYYTVRKKVTKVNTSFAPDYFGRKEFWI